MIGRTTIPWRLATETDSERDQMGGPGPSVPIDLTSDPDDEDNGEEIAYVCDEKLQPFVEAQQGDIASNSNRVVPASTVAATAPTVTDPGLTSAAAAPAGSVVAAATGPHSAVQVESSPSSPSAMASTSSATLCSSSSSATSANSEPPTNSESGNQPGET